ncbi:MAG: zf-HC2 domain-containing protein [Ktedonobacteraceae bacterium]|nr:zf-HC2 domain-containing protein [Ktedonobacteraceae bacterium]
MAKQERHFTTTELSAFLDGQLSAQEQALCEEHLKGCEQCRQTLAELRQTVALLRALPPPALPRSFLLSADETAAPAAVRRVRNFNEIRPALPLRRVAKPSYVQNALRNLSVLAAVIGLFFLLSGIFSTPLTSLSGGRPTSAPALSSASQRPAATPSAVSHAAETPTAKMTKPGANTHPVMQPWVFTPLQLLLAAFDLGTQQGRVLMGLVLLAIGIVGFFVITRWQRS